jgi:hypothetical protein
LRHLVVDLMSSTPHMRMPAWVADHLRGATRDGWRTTIINSPSVSVGSGTSAVSDETLSAIVDAESYFGYGVSALDVEGAALRWAARMAAGVGTSITPTIGARGLVFTNSAGIYGEGRRTILGGVLHFLRGLYVAVRQQAASTDQTPFPPEIRMRELDECRPGHRRRRYRECRGAPVFGTWAGVPAFVAGRSWDDPPDSTVAGLQILTRRSETGRGGADGTGHGRHGRAAERLAFGVAPTRRNRRERSARFLDR